MKKLLLIIPCYNEAKNIEFLLTSLCQLEIKGFSISVLPINDGSRDTTLQKIKSYNHIHLSNNLGIGGAVQTGIKYAKLDNFDYAIQIDGDGQHPVEELQKLVTFDKLETFDIVIGSRFITKNGFQSSFLRRFGIQLINFIIRMTTGKRITDSTSGFRLMNKTAIALFAENYPDKYPEPESLVYALLKGLKVTELPVEMKHREDGKSSISGFFSFYYMVKVSLAIFFIKLGFVLKMNKK